MGTFQQFVEWVCLAGLTAVGAFALLRLVWRHRLDNAAIAKGTNSVELVLFRPESGASCAADVTLAALANLAQRGSWRAITNLVFAAGETSLAVSVPAGLLGENSISNMAFFAFGGAFDADFDGLDDWEETLNFGTDPALADTDGDGLDDGLEAWFGADPLVYAHSLENGPMDPPGVARWTVVPGPADYPMPSDGDVVWERTLAVARTGAWQQFFLSASPSSAAGWFLPAGAVLEWEDSGGASGSASASPPGDSLRLQLSPDALTVTFRLRSSAPLHMATPLRLLSYVPELTIDGAVVLEDDWGCPVEVFPQGLSDGLHVRVDRSLRPCSAPLSEEEADVGALLLADFARDGLCWVEGVTYDGTSAGGVLRLPEAGLYPRPGGVMWLPPFDGIYVEEMLVLDASLRCDFAGMCGAGGVAYDPVSGAHEAVDAYPFDSSCLRRGLAAGADGALGAAARHEVSAGVDTNECGFVECRHRVSNGRCVGSVLAWGEEVWTHAEDGGAASPGVADALTDPLSDECGCGGCADGDCDALEAPEAAPLRFRVPLGSPRMGQVSGFIYFSADEGLSVSPGSFLVAARDDALLSESWSGAARVLSCADDRGRDVVAEPIPGGARLTVRTHATQALEHSWEITNVDGSSSRVRFRKVSRIGSTMMDATFSRDAATGEWTREDAVSGASETVSEAGGLDAAGGGALVETRTVRDSGGRALTRRVRERARIGSGRDAVLRETRVAEQSWDGAGRGWRTVSERLAGYWDDPSSGRHGRLRLLRGSGTAWEYHDYDGDGREVLRVEQRNGSPVPSAFPGVSYGALEDCGCLSDAMVTVYGYWIPQGDSDADGDAAKPRFEERHVVQSGTAALVGRRWFRYTRLCADGFPCVRRETWRACSRSAEADDPGNAYSYETTFDEEAPGVPQAARGGLAESLDEDGVLSTRTLSLAAGVASFAERRSGPFPASAPHPVCSVVDLDAVRGTTLREAAYVAAGGVGVTGLAEDALVEEKVSIYDEKDRLRSTTCLDGTFSTNHYSCCRLLHSIDGSGRKTLRSAVTGEDHLYYATEEVSLADLPHDDRYVPYADMYESDMRAYRTTQHFMDALGRETNTVVRTCKVQGAATNATWTCKGWRSSETVEYPFGTSDHEVRTDARGNVTTTVRTHFADRECVETAETNKTTTVTTFRNGGTATMEDWAGGAWRETVQSNCYDAAGCLVDVTAVAASDHEAVATRVAYRDFLGRVVREVRPTSDVSYTYDGASPRVLSATDSISGETVTRLYNDLGEAVGQVKNGVTNRTDTTYEVSSNVLWRVTTQTTAVGRVVPNAPPGGTRSVASVTKERLTGLSDELRSETFEYRNGALALHAHSSFDPTNAVLTEVSESATSGTTTTKSKYGIVIETTTSAGTITNFFDPYGRVFYTEKDGRSVDWIGRNDFGDVEEYDVFYAWRDNVYAEFYAYDIFGNRIIATNALGAVTYSAYDAENRLAESGGATYPVRYAYDTDGRRTSLTTFRDAGGPGSVPAAAGDTTTWTFDPATGFCTVKTYADGSANAYTYTSDGKPLRTTYASGRWRENAYNARRELSSVEYSDGEASSFDYDEFSHEIAASNSVAFVQLLRNDYGQVTNETTTITGGSSFCSTVVRRFDAYGRLAESDGSAYAYAPDGQVASISNVIAVVEYLYTADRLDAGYALTLSNGLVFTRSLMRDAYRRSLVTDITNSVNGIDVETFSYAYDALNRSTSRNADTFGYNDRSEVTSANVSGVPSTYGYDEIGNSTNWTANCLNQYTEFTHDADGNMTQCGDWTYTYDAANRLKSVSTNGVQLIANFYDAKSRRVRKVTPDATTTFFYDTWNLIEERIAYTSGATSAIHYYWGKDLSGTLQGAGGVGGLLYLTVDGSIYIPTYDNNGNITRYLDANGNTVAQYTYDAFGNLISKSGPLADFFRHRFSTKYFDIETNLYYYGYRFYHPILMRWLNRDPIEEEGGVNLYGFCYNNSNGHYDKFGYEVIKSIIVKKKPIRWSKIYYSEIRKMNVTDDLYGHWWIEIENESYGWWPIKQVGFWETLVGVPGEINGIITFRGSLARDPDHGQVPDVMYHPWRNVGSLKSNRLWYGPLKGDSCRCVNEEDIKNCIRDFASKFSRINGKTWSYPFSNGNNCHDFVEKALDACCLKNRP